MAKELDITLILISQRSRAPECRSDRRPMLSDLRESGSIEMSIIIRTVRARRLLSASWRRTGMERLGLLS